VQHVGERLLAARTQDETDMRPGFRDQPSDGVGHRTVVPAAVLILEEPKCFGDWHQVRGRLRRQRQLVS